MRGISRVRVRVGVLGLRRLLALLRWWVGVRLGRGHLALSELGLRRLLALLGVGVGRVGVRVGGVGGIRVRIGRGCWRLCSLLGLLVVGSWGRILIRGLLRLRRSLSSEGVSHYGGPRHGWRGCRLDQRVEQIGFRWRGSGLSRRRSDGGGGSGHRSNRSGRGGGGTPLSPAGISRRSNRSRGSRLRRSDRCASVAEYIIQIEKIWLGGSGRGGRGSSRGRYWSRDGTS